MVMARVEKAAAQKTAVKKPFTQKNSAQKTFLGNRTQKQMAGKIATPYRRHFTKNRSFTELLPCAREDTAQEAENTPPIL